MGKIEVVFGPMFSGKTTYLINRVKQLVNQGKKVKIFKPAIDDRYGDEVVCTHDKVSLKACSIKRVKEAEVDGCDVVVVDEYFFFKDDLLDYCSKWKEEGKHIIVAGLDMNYLGNPMKFVDSKKSSEDLRRIADEVHFLKSMCAVCGGEASMTERFVKSDKEKLVGGAEVYRPVCEKHHPKWKKLKSK